MRTNAIAITVSVACLFLVSCSGGKSAPAGGGGQEAAGAVASSATTSASHDAVVGIGPARLHIAAGAIPDTGVSAVSDEAVTPPTLSERGIIVTKPVTFKFGAAAIAAGRDKMQVEIELPKTLPPDKLSVLKAGGSPILQVMIKVTGARPDAENMTLSTEWTPAIGRYNEANGTISIPIVASAGEISVAVVADRNTMTVPEAAASLNAPKSMKIPLIKDAHADEGIKWWENDWVLLHDPRVAEELCSGGACREFLLNLKEESRWIATAAGLTETAVQAISPENLPVLSDGEDPASGRNYTIRRGMITASLNVARISLNGACGSEPLFRGIAGTRCLRAMDFCRDYAGYVHFTPDIMARGKEVRTLAIVEVLAALAELQYNQPMDSSPKWKWVHEGIPAALGMIAAFPGRLWPVYGELYKDFEAPLDQPGPRGVSRQAGEFWAAAGFLAGQRMSGGAAFLGRVIREMGATCGKDPYGVVGATIDNIVRGVTGLDFKGLFREVIAERSMDTMFYPDTRRVDFAPDPMEVSGETSPMSGIIYSYTIPAESRLCTMTFEGGGAQSLIVNGTDAPSGAPYSVASAGTFAVANTDAGMADSQKAAYKIQVACEKKEEEKNLMPPCYHETYNNPDGGTISVSGPIEMVAAYRAARGLNAVRPGMTFGRCDSLSVRMSE